VSPYIIEDLALGLKGAGCGVSFLSLGDSEEALKTKLSKINPDFVLSVDGKCLDRPAIKQWGGLRVAWFVDNPFYFSEKEDLKEDGLLFVWDKEYVVDLKKLGNKTFSRPPDHKALNDTFLLPLKCCVS